ncbi:hypothetical protein [Paraburkholderia jirisanensis]
MTHLCTIKPSITRHVPADATVRAAGLRGARAAAGRQRRSGRRLQRIARHAHRDRDAARGAQHRALSPLVWRAQSSLPVCRRWSPLLDG